MVEISLITAVIGLILAGTAVVLCAGGSRRLERVVELQRETSGAVDVANEAIGKLTTELPETRVIQMEGTCRVLKEQYDKVVTAVEQHRAGVHRSIQRFDQIMRRNERAAAVIEGDVANQGVDLDEGNGTEDLVPENQKGDRSFVGDQTPPPAQSSAEPGLSWDARRRELAQRYHANRAGVVADRRVRRGQ